MLSNMIYKYFSSWSSMNKNGKREYEYEQALEKFKNKERFVVLAYRNNNVDPFAYIDFAGTDFMYINFLNDKFDIEREYLYQRLNNLNENKLFLIEVIIREFDYANENLKKFISQAYLYSFAFSDGMKNGKFNWIIRDKVHCEDTNFIKNERFVYESNNIIDVESLWEDIPEFGNWDHFLRDDKERVKFLEIKD